MKQFYFIILFFFCFTAGNAQSKVLQELKDSNYVQLGFYFTPSTLRMLNIQKDTAFDDMIKGVEKMRFLIMEPEKFSNTTYFNTADKLIKEEKYEEYIIWDGNGDELQVFGKPDTKEMVGLAKFQDQMYVFDLKGTIDLMKIPELYEKATTQDSTTLNGFSIIYDMIADDERDRTNRARWKKEREERERKRDSINTAIKVDSSAVLKENRE